MNLAYIISASSDGVQRSYQCHFKQYTFEKLQYRTGRYDVQNTPQKADEV